MRKSRLAKIAFGIGWTAAVVAVWVLGARNAMPRQLFALTIMAYLACWVSFFALSSHSRRQQIMRFTATTLSLAAAVALVELTACWGLLDYRLVFERGLQPWENPKNLLDKDLLHIHRPYYHAKGRFQGGDLVTKVNAPALTFECFDVLCDQNGFRNDADYDRADCVFLGDSFVEGGQVLSGELHTRRIANQLGITVANLGQSYYGPQQELKVLERFGIPLQPAVCVWVFFEGNDLKDVWRYREFVNDWPESVSNYSAWKEKTFTKNAFIWLSGKWRARPSQPDLEWSGEFESSQGPRRIWFGYEGGDLSARGLEALEITTAALADAYALCREQGIQLMVVFAPTKYRVYAEFCRFEHDSRVRDWKVNDLPERLSDAIAEISSEIVFLDLTPGLKQRAQDGAMLHYPDDTHWSPAGHRAVAEAISGALRMNYGKLLPRTGDSPKNAEP